MTPAEAQHLMLQNRISFRELRQLSGMTENALRGYIVRGMGELPYLLEQVIQKVAYERQKAATNDDPPAG